MMNATPRPRKDPFLPRIESAVRVLKMPLPGPAKRERGPQIMDIQARVVDAHGRVSFHDIKPFPVAVEPLGYNVSISDLLTDGGLHAFDSEPDVADAWHRVERAIKKVRKPIERAFRAATWPTAGAHWHRRPGKFEDADLNDLRFNDEIRLAAMPFIDSLLAWAAARDKAYTRAERKRLELEARELPSEREERLRAELEERDRLEYERRRADLRAADLGAVSAVTNGTPWTYGS